MMPAFGKDGKILLDQKWGISLSPDGHGGSLRAMRKSGALDEMRRSGIEYISYFQVDNPLVRCLDPLFIGLHIMSGSEMSSKSLAKADDLEKVGNFVIGDGKLMVIEYSDLPETLARAKNPDGTRKFDAGSIAIHILSREFVERITEGDLKLPYHRAVKKVPYIDPAGKLIKPVEPNAVKLEQFVFDAIPLAKNSIVLQTKREEEFSPVKNAEGVDSAVTCRRDLVARAARWLEQAGIHVERNAQGQPAAAVEISPLRAIFPSDLT
jgi:UDP-N-acetylglucosamine/UDP-N-acetylgalactosamine diphosphorylase